MTANILVNLGLAIVEKDEEFFLLNRKLPSEFRPLSDYELSQFYALKPENKEVFYSDIKELLDIIEDEYRKHDALDSALALMDKKMSDKYKIGILQLLKTTLDDFPGLNTFIENRLLSSILPKALTPDGAYSLCLNNGYDNIANFYRDLSKKSYGLSKLLTYFSLNLNIDEKLFKIIQYKLADEGILADFTKAIYERSRSMYYQSAENALIILHTFDSDIDKNIFNRIEENLKSDNILLHSFEISSKVHKWSQIYLPLINKIKSFFPRVKVSETIPQKDIVLFFSKDREFPILKETTQDGFQIKIISSRDNAINLLNKDSVKVIISDFGSMGNEAINFLQYSYEKFPSAPRLVFISHDISPTSFETFISLVNTGYVNMFLWREQKEEEGKSIIQKCINMYRTSNENKKMTKNLSRIHYRLEYLEEIKRKLGAHGNISL